MSSSSENTLKEWYRIVREMDFEALGNLIHEDCVFHSPIVHSPQVGKKLTIMYLTAAGFMLKQKGDMKYVKEISQDDTSILEFEAEIDGIHINGVDMIEFSDGKITDFKVMIRPLKAIDKIKEMMLQLLG